MHTYSAPSFSQRHTLETVLQSLIFELNSCPSFTNEGKEAYSLLMDKNVEGSDFLNIDAGCSLN